MRSIPLGTPSGLCDGPGQSRIVAANEYLAAENRILRAHLPSRLRLPDAERSTLAEIATRLGRQARKDIARAAKPDAIRQNERMRRFVPVEALFKGRHFGQEIVVLNVRWYLTYKLSYRDLVAMMDERGIDLAHTTILRWVQYYPRNSTNAGTALRAL